MKMQNLFNQASLYFHTVKYLKPIQIWSRLTLRFNKPKIRPLHTPAPRSIIHSWASSITIKVDELSPTELCFLNKTYSIVHDDIWQNPNIDKLWLYNLHYFDQLKSRINPQWQKDFILRWIKENPPIDRNGWEPYPLSLRIVNWVKWSLNGNIPDQNILNNLALQANYLSKRIEKHLQGNHLFANAKALLFAGLYFRGRRANRWFVQGYDLVSKELKSQIHADGGHCELSPMYHAIILEDILDIINIFKVYNIAIPNEWITIVDNMFSWLITMQHPDNKIAFFNDAVFDIAPSLDNLISYSKELNLTINPEARKYLKESGFVRLEKGKVLLIADIGNIGASYQPGHAHADTFSFELSINHQRLFVNSGISTYNECKERIRQRGTAAHNTLAVNDKNSSAIWKSFRVARRANVKDVYIDETEKETNVMASHDGYYHTYRIIHHRHWQLVEKTLIIYDNVIGQGEHKISLYFHLHPSISVMNAAHKIQFYDINNEYLADLTTNYPFKIDDSTYHPEFNTSVKNKKIVIESICSLPVQFKTVINWES